MIDLIGEKFGKLTVIDKAYVKEIGKSKKKMQYWKCECECGNIVYVMSQSLRSGNTKSCGCLKKEASCKHRAKFNKFEIKEEVVKGYDDKENYFLIDLEDLEKVKQFYWSLDSKGYWHTQIWKEGKGHYLSLHRFVTGISSSEVVDHKNHIKSDNRKNNLRICSQVDNCKNVSLGIKNTSGFLGVSFHKQTNKWTAQIKLNNKKKHLGSFANKEEAIKARLKAEKEYFGDFAPQRYLFKEYSIDD